MDEADFLAVFPLTGEGRARLIGTVRDERADHPGTYHLSGEHVEVALRPARFADETRAAQRLTITTAYRLTRVPLITKIPCSGTHRD